MKKAYKAMKAGHPFNPMTTHTTTDVDPHVLSRGVFSDNVGARTPFCDLGSRQPRGLTTSMIDHVNILISSLALGGAERVVQEVVTATRERGGSGRLFVLHDAVPSHPLTSTQQFPVIRLGTLPRIQRLQRVALDVLSSPSRILITHLIRAPDLAVLWSMGVLTIPVIHNARPGWQDDPSVYAVAEVPFVVACCEAVATDLRAAGCPKPVVALRHELQTRPTAESLAQDRVMIRSRHAIPNDTVLVGMIGQFKAQKAYTRAVRVLAALQQHVEAKLMILGGWDHVHGHGRAAMTATCTQAIALGVMPDVLLPGPVHPVEPYLAAFDVFLQTSVYEGLSLALLEAINTACPVVAAKVGGSAEVVSDDDGLIDDGSDIEAYVGAILRQRGKQRLLPPPRPRADLIPRVWSMLARHAARDALSSVVKDGTLFLTSNLNIGGAQRSLVNLLTHLPSSYHRVVCVLDRITCEEYLTQLEHRGIPVLSTSDCSSMLARVDTIVDFALRLRMQTICFWNVPADVKLLVTKVLELHSIRLVDVSPGPMLFEELRRADDMRRRLSIPTDGYFRRLDGFVAKYSAGGPPEEWVCAPEKVHLIPNGVPHDADPITPRTERSPLPADADPMLAFGTCCRIAPSKRIEFLIDVAAIVGKRLPGATMTIVGGVDRRHEEYWEHIATKLERERITNVFFAGPQGDVSRYLSVFRAFLMISDDQGCPNASLEAMAYGIPVVANASGGTEEQVRHGVNGYVVSDMEPHEAAHYIEMLLREPHSARRLGDSARMHVTQNFSMTNMVSRYLQVLGARDHLTGDHQ